MPADVAAAAHRIAGVVVRTLPVRTDALDERTGMAVWCKPENLQRGGAFKLRGAANALAALDPVVRARGVVTFSSGNHGACLALAASLHGVSATVVMPDDAPAAKRRNVERYGGRIVGYDRYGQDREALAREVVAETGATLVPPFDHPDVVAGQGTAALELAEDLAAAGEPALDVLVVPVGGGGLLAGSSAALADASPTTRVVGVEPAGRRAARESIATGDVVVVEVPRTIADGQQTTHVGAVPVATMRDRVSQVAGVTDDEIRTAMRVAATDLHLVVEPSGASALAAVLAGRIEVPAGASVGVVLSGGNVDLDRYLALLAE